MDYLVFEKGIETYDIAKVTTEFETCKDCR